MLSPNPFTERTFSSSAVTELSKERRYFPYTPHYYTKPGFLMPNEEGFPKITSESGPTFWKSGVKNNKRIRGEYTQNPFHKSHLLQDSEFLGSSNKLYGSASINGYGYGEMYESRVRPVYLDGYYSPNKNYFYDPAEVPNSKIQSKTHDNLDNPENTFTKKQSIESPRLPKSSMQRIKSNESTIQKIYEINERPSIEEDDPLNYNYPSFNNKNIFKRESQESPRWGSGKNTAYLRTENEGMQTSNKREGLSDVVQFEGRNFYLIDHKPI